MNTVTKVGGFILGLVAVFGTAYGVGQLTGPVTPAVETRHDATDPGHPGDGRSPDAEHGVHDHGHN
ncbi:hypothetical protein AB0C02_01095 [Micromonospora sp. NPDC048999]|uniref:hypothetical protein n=1 Tax=Micromonospora sp. NPDC048999 TaxID=3155391 RepID=UPI00340FEB40